MLFYLSALTPKPTCWLIIPLAPNNYRVRIIHVKYYQDPLVSPYLWYTSEWVIKENETLLTN